ncbi:MAG: 16S rRNA (cytosine(1402)-N(4))-methyltransferase RsmH [Clostridia bacterium]|jgi:16S rRNA (cytosine1402-N4)-methyltransferase|nr:16S rRNA (cytosine(1402)-N(4))-methyltransferase RsmH [Clostridia bacterium]
MEFKHISVLLNECIDNLNIRENKIYVDGTTGGAGHSKEICKSMNDSGMFIGIDQDENALAVAKERLSEFENVKLVRDNFSNINRVLDGLDVEKIDGMLLDLGVSSHQLDEASRGFSYRFDAELDMRMDNRQNLTAKYIVNNYSEDELERILRDYGEEKWSRRIAKFIVEFRAKEEINTTFELVDILKRAIPKAARMDKHPGKRTFQALRIEVNNEIGILENTIKSIVERLNPKGRLCIITFHSLEDRVVKNVFKELATGCKCPKEIPMCICGETPKVKIITRKAILPTDEEVEHNLRSRSAKLRVIEKI